MQIGINTGHKTGSQWGVRGPHHDKLEEVYAGLLYLRHPNDTSTGAELQRAFATPFTIKPDCVPAALG